MKITVAQYTAHTGYSTQKVGYRIRNGKPLPGIVSSKKFGQTYVLEAAENWKELAKPLGRYVHVANQVGYSD